jgi:plasmid stability protein
MATIVIKNLSDDLHARLKLQAQRHNRSVTKEVVTLIQNSVSGVRRPPALPPPIKLKSGQIRIADIEAAIAEGRD